MLKEKNIHIDPKKKARDLTGEDWLALVKVFQEWPFKPEVSQLEQLSFEFFFLPVTPQLIPDGREKSTPPNDFSTN